MAKRKQKKQKTPDSKILSFTFRRRRFRVLLDKVLIFRLVRNLHGRFWGLAGVNVMIIGFSVCFAIEPELLDISTEFSEFGNDVRTAPYFSGSVFFAAYGLWRWRNYVSRTWRRSMPITGLITLTILGLYLVALMPVSWKPWPNRIHMFGLALAGLSMLATVVLDELLTKPRLGSRTKLWRLVRWTSFAAIVSGGWFTLASSEILGWYDVSLLGEVLMLGGYALWIMMKTYLGEGNRTILARNLRKIVLID